MTPKTKSLFDEEKSPEFLEPEQDFPKDFEENYTPRVNRIIITFKDEEKDRLMKILNLESLDKFVYEAGEILK